MKIKKPNKMKKIFLMQKMNIKELNNINNQQQ